MRWKDVPECDIFLVMPLWSKEQQPVVQQRTISATSTKLRHQSSDLSQHEAYLKNFQFPRLLPSVCFETSEASKTAAMGYALISPK